LRNCYALWIALSPREFNQQTIALLADGRRASHRPAEVLARTFTLDELERVMAVAVAAAEQQQQQNHQQQPAIAAALSSGEDTR
jgi:hypothetical protein